MTENASVPSKLWGFWLDGVTHMPELSRRTYDMWQRLNPEWDMTILTGRDVKQLLQPYPAFVWDRPPVVVADLVRVEILAKEGGVWVDPSVLPAKPIKDWLPSVSTSGFFAFEKPGPDRPLSSCFLAAKQAHPILMAWRTEARRYWQKDRELHMDPRDGNPVVEDPTGWVAPETASGYDSYPYFWLHYLFGYLLASDPSFAEEWRACQDLPAGPPHALQRLVRTGKTDDIDLLWETYKTAAPVHKLDWRLTIPDAFMDRLLSDA